MWVARNGEEPAEAYEVSERGFKLTLAVVGYAATVGLGALCPFSIFVCSTGNLFLVAFRTLLNLMHIPSSTGFRFFRYLSVWRLWLTYVRVSVVDRALSCLLLLLSHDNANFYCFVQNVRSFMFFSQLVTSGHIRFSRLFRVPCTSSLPYSSVSASHLWTTGFHYTSVVTSLSSKGSFEVLGSRPTLLPKGRLP